MHSFYSIKVSSHIYDMQTILSDSERGEKEVQSSAERGR
jgi:hypothetical protein